MTELNIKLKRMLQPKYPAFVSYKDTDKSKVFIAVYGARWDNGRFVESKFRNKDVEVIIHHYINFENGWDFLLLGTHHEQIKNYFKKLKVEAAEDFWKI